MPVILFLTCFRANFQTDLVKSYQIADIFYPRELAIAGGSQLFAVSSKISDSSYSVIYKIDIGSTRNLDSQFGEQVNSSRNLAGETILWANEMHSQLLGTTLGKSWMAYNSDTVILNLITYRIRCM